VPAVSKVWLKLALFLRLPDLKLPSSAATVCVALSWLVQVTVSPTLMVTVLSSNLKPLISTSKTFPDESGAEVADATSLGAEVADASSLGADIGSMLSIASVIKGAKVATSLEGLLGAQAARKLARVNIVNNDLIFI
jgi:hypothetical protein